MNQIVLDSKILQEEFDIRTIRVSYAKDTADLGKLRLKKFLVFIELCFKLLFELIFRNNDLIYFQISPNGFVFIRDVILIILIKLFKKKIVYHLHGKGIINSSKNHLMKLLYKFAFNNSNIICLSNLLSYDIINVYTGQVHILNNGIPDIHHSFPKLNYEWKNDVIKILFLSNLFKSKGIIVFLDSLKIIENKNICFNSIIIGGRGDYDEEEMAYEISLRHYSNKVIYLGPLYDEDKITSLCSVDVLIYPSFNDAFPLVLLELMQLGKAIVATKEGAIPEIIEDGINGLLVDKNSPQQIADKVEYLSDNPEIRMQLGKAARKKYEENYQIEIFENNLKSIIKELMKN